MKRFAHTMNKDIVLLGLIVVLGIVLLSLTWAIDQLLKLGSTLTKLVS